MSLFSAYSVANSIERGLAYSLQECDTTLTPKPTSIGLFLADVLECSVPICPWPSLTFGSFIGSGTSMDVWQGTFNSKPVAIKRLRIDEAPQSLTSVDASNRGFVLKLKAAALELRSMSLPGLQRCPNVVDLLAVSWNEEGPDWQRHLWPALVVEIAADETPNLERLIPTLNNKNLDILRDLLNDVLEGLQAIHNSGIVHGDIKPENVLVFHDSTRANEYIAKLSDFGFSQLDPDSELASGGTPYWNAPECIPTCNPELSRFKTASKRDVYSFGLLATYVLSGQKPFSSDAAEDWPGKQSKVESFKLEDSVSSLVRQFVLRTIRIKPPMMPKFDLDNMTALGETVQDLNCRLVNREYAFEFYNHDTGSWEEADGWIPIGFVFFLSFTVCRDPPDRPSIPELRKFWGFSRPEDYSKFHRPPTDIPLLGWKASATRAAEGKTPFPHEHVPESMRTDLFRHIKLEAESEDCDAVLKAFVADWYQIGFGVDKNNDEWYRWALKAALAPCRSKAAKFGLTVEVLRMKESGYGDLEEDAEREMLAQCLSYIALLLESGGDQNNVKAGITEFAENISKAGVISMNTLRREYRHSATFPRSSYPMLTASSDLNTFLEALESMKSFTDSSSGAFIESTLVEPLRLAKAAVSSQSFTALEHLVRFQPSILEQQDSLGYSLLQYAVDLADFFAAAILSRLGANTGSLFEPQFVRTICSWGSETMLAYLAQISHNTAHLNTGTSYNLRAVIEDSGTLGDANTPAQPGSAVPALYGAIQTNNVRNLATLLTIKFDRPIDLEARMMGALTPLWMATVMHNPLSMALLIHVGANPYAPVAGYGYALRPLHYLCATGDNDNELVQVLDRLRATVESSAPLETSFGRLDSIQTDEVRNELCSILLRFGSINVNDPDSEGLTPLMWCCRRGYLNTAKHIVNESAIMVQMDATGESSRLLSPVDFTLRDNKQRSALDHAILAGHADISCWLREMAETGTETPGTITDA